MNPTKHATKWQEIAQLPESQVREYILTNHESLGWEASTKPLMDLIQDWVDFHFISPSVLDYGCGMGRNLVPLAAHGYSPFGFDTTPMINAAIPLIEKSGYIIPLFDNFQDVRDLSGMIYRFDLILVSLVAQHMHPDDLREAFSQFPKMGRNLLVTGRDWNDFVPRDQKPMATWELIDEALGDSMILAREEHGPDDHGTKLWTART